MNNLLIYIYQPIKLLNSQDIEVLMNKEEFEFMEILRIFDTLHDDFHHFLIHFDFLV